MELSRYTELFLSEAREHISTTNRLLLLLEGQPENPGLIDGIFRAVHTLKGAAAAMGYTAAAELAHAMEHLLERLRRGEIRVDTEAVDLLLSGVDALERAIEQPTEGLHAPLVERLEERAGDAAPAAAPAGGGEADLPAPPAGARALRVRVAIAADSPLPAARAMLVLRGVRTLGEVSGLEPAEERIAAGELPGPFHFLLATAADEDRVRAVVAAAGEVAEVDVALHAPAPRPAGPGAGEGPAEPPGGSGPIVRVRQERLDALVDQVGELVIARDRLRRAGVAHDDPELESAVAQIVALVGELRDEVMSLRLVPIGDAFDRFPRLVRDAARALGKRVDFELVGRHQQLDRGLLNEVGDLVVHLLRNAVDHGVETAAERRAAGKPESGRVRLTAERDGSAVLIRVEDDGRGLQRERILRSAVARGVVAEGEAAAMTDEDVYHLITRPGISTAERVTDVSGRGVGMDVVHSRAQALGGSVEVRSAEGRGTTVTLRLPLTLSIVRTLQVGVGPEVYALPILAVAEVTEMRPGDEVRLGEGEGLPVRGAVLPLVSLPALLASAAPRPPSGYAPVVVVETGEARYGLLVDELYGQHDAVVKPFDGTTEMLHVFSGATLLADGRPCLILDPARLAMASGSVPQAALA